MANPMTSTKRFSVRLALVTSSTVAMIVGAQTLATLDVVNAAPASVDTTQNTTTQATVPQAAPQITILRHAAPALTFQARTGTTTTTAPAQVAARPTMQPPVAVVVPQSSQMSMSIPTTRSSR